MEWGVSEICVWWLPLVGCTSGGKLLDLAGPQLPCLQNSDENTHCPDRQGLVWGLNEITFENT